MMPLLTSGGLGHAFRGSTDAAAHQKFLARQLDEQRLRRERREERLDDNTEFLDAALSLVAVSDIQGFKADLDLYGTATVTALQDNDIQFARVQAQLDQIFAKAYVLPDGRRVFKTEDGLRVFDEHGQELAEETIRPDEIEDFRERWESVKPVIDAREALVKERDGLIAYQEKLDAADERLDTGAITRAEFNELREDLKADMPDAVRAHVPGMEAKDMSSLDASSEAEELDITDDMVPTARTVKAVLPAFSG